MITPADTADDPVQAPAHYRNHPSGIECIEVTRLLGFAIGNAVKYVWRRGDKGNPAQDLDKSLFYLADARNNAPKGRLRRFLARRGWTSEPDPLRVPSLAAALLWEAAKSEPNPTAKLFFVAVAKGRWDAAEDAVRTLRAALPDGSQAVVENEEQPTATLGDDLIFRGTVVALRQLRGVGVDQPNHSAYRSAAAAWVYEAQLRLADGAQGGAEKSSLPDPQKVV